MKLKLLLLFLFNSYFIFSQSDSSKALIFFKPKTAIIYLDGKKIESRNELRKIAIGSHHIQAWAPKHDFFTDSFFVRKKENKFYSKKLRYSESYKIYKTKKLTRIFTYLVPAVLAAGFSVTYYKKYMDFDERIKRSYNQALELEETYNQSFSPAEFETNYRDYYEKVNDYEKLQEDQKKCKTQGIVIGSALAGTAVTMFIIQLTRKKKPYQEETLLSRVIPGFNPLNKQICVTVHIY